MFIPTFNKEEKTVSFDLTEVYLINYNNNCKESRDWIREFRSRQNGRPIEMKHNGLVNFKTIIAYDRTGVRLSTTIL